jgi:hypothetical protein
MPRKTTAMKKRKTKTTSKSPVKKSRKAGPPADLDEIIQKRAYEIYLDKGDSGNDSLDNWLQAEMEIKAKYDIQ